MKVLECHCVDGTSCPLFDCTDCSINLSNMFFGVGGVHNGISISLFIVFSKSISMSTFCTTIIFL